MMKKSERAALVLMMERIRLRVTADNYPEFKRRGVLSAIERCNIHLKILDPKLDDIFFEGCQHSVGMLLLENDRALAPGHGDCEWACADELVKDWWVRRGGVLAKRHKGRFTSRAQLLGDE